MGLGLRKLRSEKDVKGKLRKQQPGGSIESSNTVCHLEFSISYADQNDSS